MNCRRSASSERLSRARVEIPGNRLTKLEDLDISYTNTTDAALENLSALKSLKILAICGTHVTDGGMEHLPRPDSTGVAQPA